MQKTDKLISANALLEKVQFRIDTPGIIGSTVRDMVATTRRIIEEAPAVDAVEVVECADCWNCEEIDNCLYCTHWEKNTYAGDFCCHGERRADNGVC